MHQLHLFIISTLTIFTLATANAATEPPHTPQATCPMGQNDRALLDLKGQRFTGRNTLALRQMFNLDQSCAGIVVSKVILFAMTDFGNGRASLLINDRLESTTRVNSFYTRYDFELGVMNQLETDVHSLQLELDGNFNIDHVVVITGSGPVKTASTGVFLGKTSLGECTSLSTTLEIPPTFAPLNQIHFVATDDDFKIDNIVLHYADSVETAVITDTTLQQFSPYFIKLQPGHRPLQSITLRGRQQHAWGTRGNVAVYAN